MQCISQKWESKGHSRKRNFNEESKYSRKLNTVTNNSEKNIFIFKKITTKKYIPTIWFIRKQILDTQKSEKLNGDFKPLYSRVFSDYPDGHNIRPICEKNQGFSVIPSTGEAATWSDLSLNNQEGSLDHAGSFNC